MKRYRTISTVVVFEFKGGGVYRSRRLFTIEDVHLRGADGHSMRQRGRCRGVAVTDGKREAQWVFGGVVMWMKNTSSAG
jgi:hypothetical protein